MRGQCGCPFKRQYQRQVDSLIKVINFVNHYKIKFELFCVKLEHLLCSVPGLGVMVPVYTMLVLHYMRMLDFRYCTLMVPETKKFWVTSKIWGSRCE